MVSRRSATTTASHRAPKSSAMEAFMKVVTYIDPSSVRAFLKAFPFLQKKTRLLVDTAFNGRLYFMDKKLKIPPPSLFHEFDPKTKTQCDITLIELTMPAVTVILAHPERYINHFDPFTFIHIEIEHFEFQLWKFLELIKCRGARCSLERAEGWARFAPMVFTSLDLSLTQTYNLRTLHIYQIEIINDLQLDHLECLKITFKPSDTPPVINNLQAPLVTDFRVHFQGAVPEFNGVEVGCNTPLFSPKPVGGTSFELADSRCLEYANGRSYDSTRHDLRHVFASNFSFTQAFERIILIGVPNCVVNRCDFTRLIRLTWRRTCLFNGDEKCRDIRPGRYDSRPLCLHYESNIPGETLPLLLYPFWNTISIKDSTGGSNSSMLRYHRMPEPSCIWKFIGALAVVSEPWCPSTIPHYSPLYSIPKYHMLLINTVPDVTSTLDMRSQFVFIALPKSALTGSGYTIRLKHTRQSPVPHTAPPNQVNRPMAMTPTKEEIHIFAIYVTGLVPKKTLGKLFRIQYDPKEYGLDYLVTGNGLRDPQVFAYERAQTRHQVKVVESISSVFKTLVNPAYRS